MLIYIGTIFLSIKVLNFNIIATHVIVALEYWLVFYLLRKNNINKAI